jgi:hypothetical protein
MFRELQYPIQLESGLETTQYHQLEGGVRLDEYNHSVVNPDTRQRVYSWINDAHDMPWSDPNIRTTSSQGPERRRATTSSTGTHFDRNAWRHNMMGTESRSNESAQILQAGGDTMFMYSDTELAPNEHLRVPFNSPNTWPEGLELTAEQAEMVKEEVGLELSDPYRVWSLDHL